MEACRNFCKRGQGEKKSLHIEKKAPHKDKKGPPDGKYISSRREASAYSWPPCGRPWPILAASRRQLYNTYFIKVMIIILIFSEINLILFIVLYLQSCNANCYFPSYLWETRTE